MEFENVTSNDDVLVSDKTSDEESNEVESGVGNQGNANQPVSDRVKRRAKRLNRQNSKEGAGGQAAGGPGFLQTTRRWKNSRRPRNGHGRGLPKKGYYNFINIYLQQKSI